MFSRIVVPTDGSEASQRATRVAAKIAAQNASELILLTVVRVPQSLVMVAGASGVVDDYVREATQKALEPARAVLRAVGATAKERVEVGSPGRVIVEIAQSMQAGLVVMGKCGHGEFAGMLLGSVSDHVAHHLDVPLMLVP